MAKITDIDLPYLEFAEAAAPSTPAAGIVRIYAKTDGSLYQKDDAGTETGLAGGGGGAVATDTIWDAKGDLAAGTGADTASKLTVGTNGYVLSADSAQSTGLKWASPSGLLAYNLRTTGTYSTTSSTFTDVDATNMVVTFTAPSTGNVLIRLSAFCDIQAAAAASFGRWSLREGSTDLTVGGSVIRANSATVGADNYESIVIIRTGLTPGNSYTYKWSFKSSDNASDFRILCGPGGDESPPATMEVWAAP